MAEVLELVPGQKIRLGRVSYEVQENTNLPASLVEQDEEKTQGTRQVLYVCPKGCTSSGTKRPWKIRCTNSQHELEPAKCGVCGEVVVEGVPQGKGNTHEG